MLCSSACILCFFVFCCLVVLVLVVITSASDLLERLFSDMTYNMLVGTLYSTYSLTQYQKIVRVEHLCIVTGYRLSYQLSFLIDGILYKSS